MFYSKKDIPYYRIIAFDPISKTEKVICELKQWINAPIQIQNGNLLTGIFDKKIIGTSKNSIIHHIYIYKGDEICKNFIDKLQKLLNKFMLSISSSINIEDFIIKPNIKSNLKKDIHNLVKNEELIDD